MNKKLLFSVMLFASFGAFSQFVVHNPDDCKLLDVYSTGNIDSYNPVAANPITDAGNVNVSEIDPTTSGAIIQFNLPYSIPASASGTLDWSFRFYSASAGSNTSGQGRMIIRMFNRSLGAGASNRVQLGIINKTGGTWQVESGTVGLNPANIAGVNAKGGFNAFYILPANGAGVPSGDLESLFVDDISFSQDYNIADPTADLLAGNTWLYDSREGNFKADPYLLSGATLDVVASPSTTTNNSPNVLRVTRGAGTTSLIQFNHGNIDHTGGGTVKFRVYVECQSPVTNVLRYFLRKDNDVPTQRTTQERALVAGIWNDIEIDLASMDGTTGANDHNQSLFLFDFGVDSGADGDIYYIDALQMPVFTASFDNSAADNNWGTAANWSDDTLPNGLFNVTIPTGQSPVVGSTTGASVNNLTLEGTGNLTVNSGASLISTGTVTGNVIHKIAITDTNWHLIASPNTNASVYDFLSNHTLDPGGSGTTPAKNVALALYDNTQANVNDRWAYYVDGDFDNANGDDTNDIMTSGKGFSVKLASAGDLTVVGGFKTDDLLMTINQNSTNWNLVGNPFSSYIKVEDILLANSSSISGTHAFVYVYNGSAYVTVPSADYIAPGQGFFVNAANSTVNNFTITESLQSHQTGVTFYKNSSPKITLFLSDGASTRNTEIEYNSNATTSLDRGLDAGTFSGVPSSFSVYSHLVTDSEGVDFMRQLLPNSDYENMVVPVGVNAVKNKEITFTSDAQNLPNGIKVYLEDRLTNTFTELSNNGNYKVTSSENLNGIGRFYIHTTSSALSTDDVLLENISIYKTNNSNLRIVGLSQGKSNFKLFNILGKQIMNTSFISDGVKDITLPNLAKGVYIVQLENDSSKLNKRIILE
tara:strand:- start:4373 stop:6991 length:2619 start_codon:yes stop_codon:yes gene_type:complete